MVISRIRFIGCLVLVLLGKITTAQEPQQPEAKPPPTQSSGEEAADPASEPTDGSIADLSLEELMNVQVVVTASRREEKLEGVPYAMTVITKEDIRLSGARSVPEALRLAGGVDVAELSYGNAAVAPRGFHGFLSRQVLVLVDGRQIYDSHFGGTLWGSWPFQLEDIERIEVIRGPAGVTWGANAVNGVINIITKDPADQLGVTLSLMGGTDGANKEHVGYGFKDEKVRMRLSGEFEGSEGFKEGGAWLRGLEDDYQALRFNLYGIYEKNKDDKFTFSAGSGVVDGGFSRTPLAGLGYAREAGSQANFVQGKWTHRIEDGNTLELTAYVNDFWASPGIKQIDYRYQQIAVQIGHSFHPAENHTFTWGFDTRTDLLDASNSDPQMLSKDFVSTAILGLYAEDQWRFAPKWSLNLGGRIDYEFYGGFQPSARAALLRELSDSSNIYGAISRAFQMPPVGLRFVDMPMLNGLAWVEGDSELDPEILLAYEIGYRKRFFDRLQLGVTGFWHEYSDTTTLSPTIGPPGFMVLDLDNRAEGSLYGAEVEARYPINKKLTLVSNYTFQEFDWRASVPFHDKDLMSPPQNKAMMGVQYSPWDDLHLSSYLYYVDTVEAPNVNIPFISRTIDSYIRLDLRAEYEFWKDNASIAVGVRNLTDNQHPEGGTLFVNYAEVPRMVYAECRVAIRKR